MKIVYLITRADEIGGAQIHVRDLALAARTAGHQVTVITGPRGPLSEDLEAEGVPVRVVADLIRPISPRRDLVAFRALLRTIRELAPDLVTTHSSKAGLLGRIAAHRLGVPVIFTAHGWAFTEGVPAVKRRLYALAERFAGTYGDHIITVSAHDRTLALVNRITTPDRITCIRNGVHDVLASGSRLPPGMPVRILMLGRFTAQKDHESLLCALAGIDPGTWSLELAGDGPELQRIETRARELGIRDQVHVLGPRRDVDALLRASDIYALISHWEGLPNSILEAMSAGAPVVASDVGGVREAVVDGETGLLIPRGDVERLREALERLINDPAQRARLGAAGRRRYEEAFRFEYMRDRTLELYAQVAAQGCRPA